jgi:hypothetical protein
VPPQLVFGNCAQQKRTLAKAAAKAADDDDDDDDDITRFCLYSRRVFFYVSLVYEPKKRPVLFFYG